MWITCCYRWLWLFRFTAFYFSKAYPAQQRPTILRPSCSPSSWALWGAWFLTLIDYHTLGNFWYLIAGFSIFLMLYTMVFGISITNEGGVNAKAWISIGGKTFQSSELVKIAFMITFSKHLELVCSRGLQDRFSMVLLLFAHALVPMGLCHLQGDDGAAVIFFFMFLCMSWAAGIRKRYFLLLFGLALIAVPLLWQFVLSDYQKARYYGGL